MVLSPLDIQKKEFGRSFRGYNQEEVDQFLDQLVQDLESVQKQNNTLAEKLEHSEASRSRYQEMEQLIKDALIMAQKNADDLVRNARQEAEVILEEARLNAEKIVGAAEEKSQQMLQEARERARFRIREADEQVRKALDEYRFLEREANIFRVKYRAMLEAQLSLLSEQEEVALGLMQNVIPGQQEVAAGYDEEDSGPEMDNQEQDASDNFTREVENR